jgi:RNA polymerase sigma-70 factor (ECF subfamily)
MRVSRVARNWRFGGAKVSTWLYRVTANICIGHLRRRRPVALDAAALATDRRMPPEARADALQTALDGLPARQREAVILHLIAG